ncbi:uncharacterized protein BYT42DRAFT_480885, partial [Radiomyces spectabilis]|uniref:uncharacterized protein n=1 Tax=Radiomyces spectabilis TaxID=64574 RepID=UPI00221E9409
KRARNPRKRIFRCTGYGACQMVFTRSEHLVRHTRKHTGEKPFRCIVPECSRMFSRFDNMMQHTQTHSQRVIKKPTSSLLSSLPTVSSSTSSSANHRTNQDLGTRLSQKQVHITQDEFEALQGFSCFRHTETFIDSLRSLAATARIEPNP